jgi:hypothetical protein
MLDKKEGLWDFWIAESGKFWVTIGAAICGTANCREVLRTAVDAAIKELVTPRWDTKSAAYRAYG